MRVSLIPEPPVEREVFLSDFKNLSTANLRFIGDIYDKYNNNDYKDFIRYSIEGGEKSTSKAIKLFALYREYAADFKKEMGNIAAKIELSDGQRERLGNYIVDRLQAFMRIVGLYHQVNDYIAKVILENSLLGLMMLRNLSDQQEFKGMGEITALAMELIEFNKSNLKKPEIWGKANFKTLVDKDILPNLKTYAQKSFRIGTSLSLPDIVSNFQRNYYWLGCCKSAEKSITKSLGVSHILDNAIRPSLTASLKQFSTFRKDWNETKKKHNLADWPSIKFSKPMQGDIEKLKEEIGIKLNFWWGPPIEMRLVAGDWQIKYTPIFRE